MKNMSINLKDPRYRVPLLIILISGLGFYGWYSQMLTPILDEQAKHQKDLKQKLDTLRVIQSLKPQLASLQKEIEVSQKKLDSLKSIFPDQKEIPKLIREITAVANASGIRTTKFNPMPDVEKEYYIENKYSIGVEGGYHSLADFYAFLANFTLIVNLSNVQISANNMLDNPAVAAANKDIVNPPTTVAMFEMTTFSSRR